VFSGGPRRLYKARFLSRPNRFTVICELNGHRTKAYLPNPGRLWELLLPGANLYLEETSRGLTVWATEKKGQIIMLHTHYTNIVAETLINAGDIAPFRGMSVERREVRFGSSRFDLLLGDGKHRFPVEVKSCTLFGNGIAMFPDAVSKRATKHLLELAHYNGKLVFLIHNPDVDAFLPEFHTDPVFAKTLYTLKETIEIIPVALHWDRHMKYKFVKQVTIPWQIYEKEAKDSGAYLLILQLNSNRKLQVGSLGTLTFKKGFYIYVGSAKANLSARIRRHLKKSKKKRWHIDYLSTVAKTIKAIPVRTSEELECKIASRLSGFLSCINGFGSSDCSCEGHLFFSPDEPLRVPDFVNTIIYFRIERLQKMLNL